MKNILKFLTIFLLVPLVFHACREAYNDDWTKPEPALNLHELGVTSNELFPTMDNNPFKLIWDNTLVNTSGDYNVVISKTSDFKSKVVLGTSKINTLVSNIATLNSTLLSAGYSPFSTEKVFIRVEVGDKVSNTISFDIKPYPIAIPVLTLPLSTSDFVLNDKTPTDVITKVNWTDYATYGVDVEYIVEVAKKGTTDFVAAGTVKNLKTLDWTHKALNDAALKAGLAPAVKSELDVKVTAVTKTTGGEIKKPSKVVTFKVTPYVAFKNLYLVGDATAAGWDPSNANILALYRDPSNLNKFYYTGKYGTSMFKLIETLGQWQPQWGLKAGAVANSDGGDPDPFNVSSAGYYTFEVDILAKTYSLTPYSGAMNTYTTIGLIGDSTQNGWGSDTVMTQSTFDPHKWYIKNIQLTKGLAKFRANSDWGVNWGADTELSGQGTQGGANIPVNEAGTYDVYFNDIDGRYQFIKR